MAATFVQNERVLCYHGPLVYEAKILKVEHWDEATTKTGILGPHYLVHYKGWKQTWDEWVDATRLLKFNETNIALQKALQSSAAQAAASTSAAKGAARAQAAKEAGRGVRKDGGTRGTKRGRDEDEGSKRPEMKLDVPESLKLLLVDDWEAVTKNNQLVPLPRSPNVVELLEEFRQYVMAQPKPTLKDPAVLLPTIVAGLQTYFDRALGANLLYRFERPQYAEIRKKYVTGPTVKVGQEKEMSSIYGAEHLLRMIVSLPQMVASSSMDAESAALVRDYVNELMTFMVKEQHRIFVHEYESASVAYQNISRS
ncbi:MRG-domain-containing protein [Obba rivulosa]|uniref:Chromatin modification-related protein EAF3 n=1 Tax=Obba rivulosa TaxID=1052685 RepID=A0A8E2B2A1_9APHY|nr:MRG-domain-containing protein [Obba rivulosa]